jgi:hypothetical protein
MELNSRASNTALGTNATNCKNIKEFIKPVKRFQGKEDLKEGSHNSAFISNYSFLFLYQANFIKSFCKGQVGCVFPGLFSYFMTQTEKLDNIHYISKDCKIFVTRC